MLLLYTQECIHMQKCSVTIFIWEKVGNTEILSTVG